MKPADRLLLIEDELRVLVWTVGPGRAPLVIPSALRVLKVDGRSLMTSMDLFATFRQVLGKSGRGGFNWDALDEDLCEIDFESGEAGLVLVFDHPECVLRRGSMTDLQILVRIWKTASETYSKPIAIDEWWDRPGVPFHVVFNIEEENLVDLSRWVEAGAGIIYA